MLLSIVMMVKNEEKYLDKTLFALNDLRRDIDSELIILDTGSNDNTVEIAKKYTDKVYFAKWNNNFADMRNISISYASGEWVLILDADEKLTNYNRLKDFFSSDLHKKYNSATIELKNIFDDKEERYSISPLLRIFKNVDGFRYEGAIHEQPKYKGPIYNNIASFDHYGYMYEDEEIRQKKTSRNMKLLLEEIEKKPNDPYTNYQLGKSYISFLNNNEAVFYIEKAWNLYNKKGRVPLFVTGDLLGLYVVTKSYIKCENLCMKYIKSDNKNIDVYYYLAVSQKYLGKYKESIKSYERYLYLLNNYEISTQANNMEASLDTAQKKDTAKSMIIEIYHKLGMYDKVVECLDDLSEDVIKNVYYIVFESLYKLNFEKKIVELYNKYPKYNHNKRDFKLHLEEFLKIVKENDKKTIYKILSNIEGNYGLLNSLRLGEKLSLSEYTDILLQEEDIYYGEVIYYALKDGFKIESILNGISNFKVEQYIGYLIITKREIILDLYNYLVSVKNTLDSKKLCIYSNLSKNLLKYSNLHDYKYEKLFLLYIKYSYDFIKNIYNEDLSDEEILNVLKDRDYIFVLKINMIQKNRNKNPLKYISDMKKLLDSYIEYKEGMEILINKFEVEFNESEELKSLKTQYKSIVENSINLGKFDEAIVMINEYETIFNKDMDLLNMKGIIAMHNGNFEEAESLFKEITTLGINYNTMFNIAYLKEYIGDVKEAISFYKRIIYNCEDKDIMFDSQQRLKFLNR